ncbi:MAG: spore coat protein U domain-containing protein [Geobacteraceae bacterium]
MSYLIVFLQVLGSSLADAASNNLIVGATVISKSNCKFNSAASAIDFGALDPGNTTDVVKSTTVDFVCHGSAPLATYAISTDDGRYESGFGAYRMRNSLQLTEYLPYSLSLTPTTGTIPKNATRTLTITGTVTSQDYRAAYAGNYADTVVISLTP